MSQPTPVSSNLSGIVERKPSRDEELIALDAIAALVNRSADLEEILNNALATVLKVTETDAGGIFVLDEETKELRLVAHSGLSPKFTQRIRESQSNQGGLFGRVVQKGGPIVVEDIAMEPGLSDLVGKEHQALVGVPLSLREALLGMMIVASHSPRQFALEDVTFLTCVSNQMGTAFEKIRLYQEVERRAEETAILHDISIATASTLDLNEALELIYEQVGRVMKISTFFVALYDEQKEELNFELFVDEGGRFERFGRPLKEGGLTGWIVRSRRPLLIHNLEEEKDNLPAEAMVTGEGHSKSWLGVPLMVKDYVIGAISVQSYQPHAFDEGHKRLLAAIASQAALVIENARLYAQTQQRVKELSSLFQASVATSSSLEVEEVLRNLAKRVARVVDATSVYIWDWNPETQTATILAHRTGPEATRQERISRLGETYSISDCYITIGVLRTRQPLSISVNDPYTGEGDKARLLELGGKTSLIVPLMTRDRIIGFLDLLESRWERQFDHRETRLCQTMANQAAIAVENAWLYESERKRVAQLKAIGAVGRHIASTLDQDELLHRVVDSLVDVFVYYYANILLVDADAGELVLRASAGHTGRTYEGLRLKIGQQGITGWVAQTGEPLLVNDVTKDPRYYLVEELSDARSELAVPIKAQGKVIGVLDVQSTQLNAFDEDDIFTLSTLADQVSVAIENAQLYRQTQHRLSEVSTLYTLAKQVVSSLELNTVLDSIVSTLKLSINCRACSLFLLDEESQMLEIKAAAGIRPRWRREARLKMGEGIAGKAVAEAKPFYIPDARQNPTFVPFDPAVRSLLVVPMISKGKVIGTLCIDDDKPDVFSPDDGRLLAIAAAQAAVAIENAQLYESSKKRAEELAKAYAELQALDRLQKEFVQNVSHELRTPLTFIKGYVELMLEEAMGELSELQRNSLHIVARRADVMTRLINNILSLQQVEMESLRFTHVSLAEVTTMALKSAEAAATKAGIVLEADIPETLPPVWADRNCLEQIFDNILGNAIKFSPDGGKIIVCIREEGEYLRVAVSDTGIGIPNDQLERIFERFYQVNGSPTRRFGGTGLGLALVKKTIEAHGGKVWAESQLGQGSTFFFTLPILRDEERTEGIEEAPWLPQPSLGR
ncbi:MAG: GAF domain-containing protein [Anaerolineales bacterium]|nr:MAG: GAF domain-containing protein [Anaerolineales bacterium]